MAFVAHRFIEPSSWRAGCAAALLLFCFGCEQRVPPTTGTKPFSPADGAADYGLYPGGPAERPNVPSDPTGTPDREPVSACPPTCTPDGRWTGCGLLRPRGTGCFRCAPTCARDSAGNEGWFDCDRHLIVLRACDAP